MCGRRRTYTERCRRGDTRCCGQHALTGSEPENSIEQWADDVEILSNVRANAARRFAALNRRR